MSAVGKESGMAAIGKAESVSERSLTLRPFSKRMLNWESSRDDDRFDQIPPVAIEVLEDGHDAIRFLARRLDEPDASLGVG